MLRQFDQGSRQPKGKGKGEGKGKGDGGKGGGGKGGGSKGTSTDAEKERRQKAALCFLCGKKRADNSSAHICGYEPAKLTKPAGGLAAGSRGKGNSGRREGTFCLFDSIADSVASMLERTSLPSPAPHDLLEWSLGKPPASEVPEQVSYISQRRTLAELFQEATTTGRITTVDSLDLIDQSMFQERPYPRPAGYPAQTVLYFVGGSRSVSSWIGARRVAPSRKK